MKEIVLNETPLKTTQGFNINNIKLNSINMPTNISEFKNVSIICDSKDVSITDINTDYSVKYGVSKDFINEAKNNSNSRINLRIKSINESKIQVNYLLDLLNPNLISNIQINADENTKATIVIKLESNEDRVGYSNLLLKVVAGLNSNIEIILINKLDRNVSNFITIDNELYENSKLNYMIVDFGGKTSVTNYYSELIGNNSSNDIKTMYLGSGAQVLDLNYIADLKGENSNVDIKVEGVLKDSSKKHFKGTIDFKKGAKKAVGNESESCLLLSDKAKAISLPMLLCTEEDVEGNHSSSAGKVDEKELFYMMSRGFSVKEALKLIAYAKFNQLISNIKSNSLREEILEIINKKLDE